MHLVVWVTLELLFLFDSVAGSVYSEGMEEGFMHLNEVDESGESGFIKLERRGKRNSILVSFNQNLERLVASVSSRISSTIPVVIVSTKSLYSQDFKVPNRL